MKQDLTCLDFRHFRPPTLETFARSWRNRTIGELRRALNAYRHDVPVVLTHAIGRADAGCSVLYDINHPSAYHVLCRFRLVHKIISFGTGRDEP